MTEPKDYRPTIPEDQPHGIKDAHRITFDYLYQLRDHANQVDTDITNIQTQINNLSTTVSSSTDVIDGGEI